MGLQYDNYTQAWEKLNELLLFGDSQVSWPKVEVSKAIYYYEVNFKVLRPEVDPLFDFGSHFNYTISKWRNLVGNYICLEELKGLKQQIIQAGKKPFNLAYQFTNKHGHGKACLISLGLTRRMGELTNTITVNMRASEVTKRLICDFLLIQRIGEYLFNKESFETIFNINQMFNDDTVLLMYHSHKPILRKLKKRSEGNSRIIALYYRLSKMLDGKESDFKKYKVHFRAFKVLRPDLYTYPVVLAKDCKIPF